MRKEIELLLKAQEGKTEFKKDEQRKKLSKIKKQLKTSRMLAVTEALKVYKPFCCFIVSKAQMQRDKIVQKMHSKDLWVGVNGKSHKGLCMHSWLSFQDCIKLHKLTVFPADAAEKQHFYVQQTIKRAQQVMVHQYISRVGVLNDYLAYLPMVYDLSMAVKGTKKSNVLIDEADLARIVLNLVLVTWVNQYNMTYSMLPSPQGPFYWTMRLSSTS